MKVTPTIRVLEAGEILVVKVPEEDREKMQNVLSSISKAKRFVVIAGYDIYVTQKKEQITVEGGNEVLRDSPASPSGSDQK